MKLASDRAFGGLFWVATLASALPLLSARYLPFTDLPEHVAAIATLDRLSRGVSDGSYELALHQSQYLLYDFVGAAITRIVGNARLANQLLLALVAILWPVSLRALLRALGRDERVALFAPMVFWNRAVILGFLPFVGSVPLCVFGLALVVRQCRSPTPARALALGILAVALFYTHVSSWVLFVAIATLMFAIAVLPRLTPRGVVETLVPFAPSALCALAWWRAGSLTSNNHSTVDRMPMTENLGAIPIWTFDVWRTHLDEVCAIAWWGAIACVIVKRSSDGASPLLHGRLRAALFVAAPLVSTLVIYFSTPFGVGTAAYLNVRLAPLVALSLLLLLRPRRDVWGLAPLLVTLATTIIGAANATYEIRRCSRDLIGDFDALLAKIRPSSRLVSLNYETRSPTVHYFPYIYAGSYHRVDSEAIAYYSFTAMPHWPVHFVYGKRPPTRLYSLSPCGFHFRRDGAYFDYVLIQGDADPFAETRVGPTYRKIASSGRFVLYEKTEPETASSANLPDETTCAPRH